MLLGLLFLHSDSQRIPSRAFSSMKEALKQYFVVHALEGKLIIKASQRCSMPTKWAVMNTLPEAAAPPTILLPSCCCPPAAQGPAQPHTTALSILTSVCTYLHQPAPKVSKRWKQGSFKWERKCWAVPVTSLPTYAISGLPSCEGS